jgi:hypothetical protein
MAATQAREVSVEMLQCAISDLVSERQRLRSQHATRVELEANRRAIVVTQWELVRVLGLRHGAGAVRSA